MANYDRPAYTWSPVSKNIPAAQAAGDFQNPNVNTASWLAQQAGMVNAFTTTTGSTNFMGGGPIVG
jgi:hypothetical protein